MVGTGGDGRPSSFLHFAGGRLPGPQPAGSRPITGAMSIEATLERVSAIRQALADPLR